jgi:hypothetical protein
VLAEILRGPQRWCGREPGVGVPLLAVGGYTATRMRGAVAREAIYEQLILERQGEEAA